MDYQHGKDGNLWKKFIEFIEIRIRTCGNMKAKIVLFIYPSSHGRWPIKQNNVSAEIYDNQ
jgi:hypothetical protein